MHSATGRHECQRHPQRSVCSVHYDFQPTNRPTCERASSGAEVLPEPHRAQHARRLIACGRAVADLHKQPHTAQCVGLKPHLRAHYHPQGANANAWLMPKLANLSRRTHNTTGTHPLPATPRHVTSTKRHGLSVCRTSSMTSPADFLALLGCLRGSSNSSRPQLGSSDSSPPPAVEAGSICVCVHLCA